MAYRKRNPEKTVHCNNCNADYDAVLETCPYCGAENKNRVIEEQFEYLKDLHDKTEHAEEHIINQRAEKGSRRVSRVAKIAIAGAVIIVVLTFLFSTARAAFETASRKKLLVKLEEEYRKNDYEAMKRTMDGISADQNYSSTRKYRNLIYAYRDMDYAKDTVTTAIKNAREYIEPGEYEDSDISWFAYIISQSFYPLYELKQYEDDGYKYREQQGVEYLRNDMETFIKENLLLSDEEMDEYFALYCGLDEDRRYSDEKEEFEPLAKLVLDRVLEKN